MRTGLQVAEMAYLALLGSGPNYRIRVQPALCALRDYIAAETGREEEDVQNDYEVRAIPLWWPDYEARA